MPMTVLLYLLAILLSAFVGGSLFKLIKQPPVVGYLLAGTVLGFFFGNSTGHEAVGFLAELGIVLLLFTLGLEFSFSRMGRMLKVALIGAVVQIILTIWIQTLVMLLLNIDFFQALFMSAAFSLSSTAIAERVGMSRGSVINHLNNLMRSGLIIRQGRYYSARSRSVYRTIEEIEEDIERIFLRMKRTAQEIDEELGIMPPRADGE